MGGGEDLLVGVHSPLADILLGHRSEFEHDHGLLGSFVGFGVLNDGRNRTVLRHDHRSATITRIVDDLGQMELHLGH